MEQLEDFRNDYLLKEAIFWRWVYQMFPEFTYALHCARLNELRLSELGGKKRIEIS